MMRWWWREESVDGAQPAHKCMLDRVGHTQMLAKVQTLEPQGRRW